MKRLTLAFIFVLALATVAYADQLCRTYTVLIDGKILYCMECCLEGGYCTVTCN